MFTRRSVSVHSRSLGSTIRSFPQALFAPRVALSRHLSIRLLASFRMMEDRERIEFKTSTEWHEWLDKHHASADAIWLVFRKKSSSIRNSLTYPAAIDAALCYGWIDGKRKTMDEERYAQYFSQRKPKSMWSKVNKAKIEALIADKRMHAAGLAVIQRAKDNGSWTSIDGVEASEVPADLEAAFVAAPAKRALFTGLSPSVRRATLLNLVAAKRPETRTKRIASIIDGLVEKPKAKKKKKKVDEDD